MSYKDRDTADEARAVEADLKSLQRHGWQHLADHPDAYKILSDLVQLADTSSMSPSERRGHVLGVLNDIVSLIPSQAAQNAVQALFGLASPNRSLSADERLKAVDLSYDKLKPARHPDQIRREKGPELRSELRVAILAWMGGKRPRLSKKSLSEAGSLFMIEAVEVLISASPKVERQEFTAISSLRKLIESAPSHLTREGFYACAQASLLLGDLYRDQGQLLNFDGADHHYKRAEAFGIEAGDASLPARARLLRLGVVLEMSVPQVPAVKLDSRWRRTLQDALANYRFFADDEDLSPVNRAWSRIWAGSVLTKLNDPDAAVREIQAGIRRLADLGAVSHGAYFKLAQAELAARRKEQALIIIQETKMPEGVSLLQVVRRDRREAEILLADPATFRLGVELLRQAANVAQASDLGHQYRSIQATRIRAGIGPDWDYSKGQSTIPFNS